jgi:hypothetical protein
VVGRVSDARHRSQQARREIAERAAKRLSHRS